MFLESSIALSANDGYADSIDTGSGTAQLIFYAGTVPATIGDAAGNQLVAFDLPNPAFGASVMNGLNAEATLGSTAADVAATGSGDRTVTHARMVDRNGLARIQFTVGESGAEIIVNDANIIVGALCNITSLIIRQPSH